MQYEESDVESVIHSALDSLAAPPPAEAEHTRRYIAETEANVSTGQPSKSKSNIKSSAQSESSSSKPSSTASNPKLITDTFISNNEKSRRVKSVHGFKSGKQLSKKPHCASLNGPGGPLSLRVELWSKAEHRLKGCPFALYKNFTTEEAAWAWIAAQVPEANVHDPASARRLHTRTPLNATNLTNVYAFIPEHRRLSGEGLMWYEDDDEELLAARQLHTPGHPSYIPDESAREEALAELLSASTSEPAAAPASSRATSDGSDGDDEEMEASQVEVLAAPARTPTKRRRPNSPTAQAPDVTPTKPIPARLPPSFNPSTDTNYIIFAVAAFVIPEEFEALLLKHYVSDPSLLGPVHLAKKKGDPVTAYLVAQVFDSSIGQVIVESLFEKDYCHVALCPRWVSASEWGHFYVLYKKQASHDQLPALAQKSVIQRLKMNCPHSHHIALDDLLCSKSDPLEIVETYHSWFGTDNAFSPFGTIETSSNF